MNITVLFIGQVFLLICLVVSDDKRIKATFLTGSLILGFIALASSFK